MRHSAFQMSRLAICWEHTTGRMRFVSFPLAWCLIASGSNVWDASALLSGAWRRLPRHLLRRSADFSVRDFCWGLAKRRPFPPTPRRLVTGFLRENAVLLRAF